MKVISISSTVHTLQFQMPFKESIPLPLLVEIPSCKAKRIRDRRRDKYEVYQVGLVWTRALGSWSCSPLALGWSGSPWSNPSWDVRHCDHHDRDHHRNVQCQFPLSYYILHKIWSVMPTCKILLLVHRHDQRSLREEFEVVHRLSH